MPRKRPAFVLIALVAAPMLRAQPQNARAQPQQPPVFRVSNLQVPTLVHVATNDQDGNFIQDQHTICTLMALKPKLAEAKINVDPVPGPVSVGHAFSLRTNPQTLERDDWPDRLESWNRTWAFLRGI